MKQKLEERIAAIKLREKGYSVNEIVEKIGVAKSSISMWVRNVPLSGKARTRLLTKIKLGQLVSAENKRKRIQEFIAGYRKEALAELETFSVDRVLGKIICSLLYWCEGAKSSFNGVRFINSDPKLIKTFLQLFRSSFNVDETKIRICLHLHEYHNLRKQIAFWSTVTAVPQNKFIRPFLKQHTGKRIRKDYPGCATIYYHSNAVARQLLATAETFLQKLGA